MIGYEKEYSWENWSLSQLDFETKSMKRGHGFGNIFSIEVHDHYPNDRVQVFVGRFVPSYQPLNVEAYR